MAIIETDNVVHISSNVSRGCPECNKWLEGHSDWEGAVNHMLDHGYKLLHVGGEADTDESNKSIQFTVAVLARPSE